MKASKIRDRIKEFRRVPASELLANPKNFRKHGKRQRKAMQSVLDEVGYADALLAYENDDGKLELIDGHLRAETTPGMQVPVLILDVDHEEALKILATHDELSAMADIDTDMLGDLISGIEFEDATIMDHFEFDQYVSDTSEVDEVPEHYPEEIDIRPPPSVIWVLAAIPLDRYGECRDHITSLRSVSDVSVEINRDEQPEGDS